ncbi:MAG: hypothetical protein COC15_04940, partial [Legionellales bacterium]
MQSYGDKLHIIRIRGGERTKFPGDNEQQNMHYQRLYGFYNGTKIPYYSLQKKHRFNSTRYPEYKHKKTLGTGGASNVKGNNSIEYV